MKYSILAATSLLVPVSALALSWHSDDVNFTDGPFGTGAQAAIDLLAAEGIVQGYPDGTFHPERTLNRAEFVKIALNAAPNRPAEADTLDCFPDVRATDWFAQYVCAAKEAGVLAGYPDGMFHPERAVNYAEAVKILVNLFDVPVNVREREVWYAPFMNAARGIGTVLPYPLAMDASLERGQMAQLAAAFVAEHAGELETYRLLEAGEPLPVQSSSSSSSSGMQSSSSQVSSSSSSSSSSAGLSLTVPTRSHFLLSGMPSDSLVRFAFTPEKSGRVTYAEVRLDRRVESLSGILLTDGTHEALLVKEPLDSLDRRYKADIASGSLLLTASADGKPSYLYVRAVMKSPVISEELMLVRSVNVSVTSSDRSGTYETAGTPDVLVEHQSAHAEITGMTNGGPAEGVLALGKKMAVGTFGVLSRSQSDVIPAITDLEFMVSQKSVTTANWFLSQPGSSQKHACSAMQNATVIRCSSIAPSIGTVLSGNALTLNADINVIGSGAYLQVALLDPGTLGTTGAVQWTDGFGRFRWLDVLPPVVKGTLWR